MLESVLLDLLIVLIVLLMVAIGVYRGGMREGFAAAGLVFGLLLALEWGATWGDWLGRNTNLSTGGATFAVSIAVMLLATILVGYGVGSAFNYHPGPGGRMFGGVLGAGSALVAIAYVLTWLRDDLFEGDEPEVVGHAWLANALDGDSGTVLLVVGGVLIVAALFASFVRERDDAETERPAAAAPTRIPDKIEATAPEPQPSAPVQVRAPRHFEDRAGSMPQRADQEWTNTWPSDAPGIPIRETPARLGEVQQARDRRKGQRDGSDSR